MSQSLKDHSFQDLWTELRLVESLAERPQGLTDAQYRTHLRALARMHRAREGEIRYRRALTTTLGRRAPGRDG